MTMMAFDTWLEKVDAFLLDTFDVGMDDLPDVDYVSLWEEGASPKSAARFAIREAGGY